MNKNLRLQRETIRHLQPGKSMKVVRRDQTPQIEGGSSFVCKASVTFVVTKIANSIWNSVRDSCVDSCKGSCVPCSDPESWPMASSARGKTRIGAGRL